MLHTRSGNVTPEGYIAGWIKEMASPMRMPDCRIALQVSHSNYASVSNGNVEAVCGILDSSGQAAAAKAIRAGGQATLSLHRDGIM